MVIIPLVSAALTIGAFQVTTVSPEVRLRQDDAGISFSVGASYRPSGETAELQRIVARQLSGGIGAIALNHLAPKPTSVQVAEDGTIALEVEHIALRSGGRASYLDSHADALASSLMTEDTELVRLAEEIAGPEAACAVKVAIRVAGVGEDGRFLTAAAELYRHPEVRAAAAAAAAAGLEATTLLAGTAYLKTTQMGQQLRETADKLAGGLSSPNSGLTNITAQLRLDAETVHRTKVVAYDRLVQLNQEARDLAGEHAREVAGRAREMVGEWWTSGNGPGSDAIRAGQARGSEALEGIAQDGQARMDHYRRDAAQAVESARENARAQQERIQAASREALRSTQERLSGLLRRGP